MERLSLVLPAHTQKSVLSTENIIMHQHSKDTFLTGLSAAYVERSRLLFPLRVYSIRLKYATDVFSSADLNQIILVHFTGNTCFVLAIRRTVLVFLSHLQCDWKMQQQTGISDAIWRSREEPEFKLRAKLFSNSCCESLIHSVDLCCVFCTLFFSCL